MMQKSFSRIGIFILIIALLFLPTISRTSALLSQNTTSWFWTSDTNVSSIVAGDVNGDGKAEIVTGGWFSDGLRYSSQLVIWNSSTLQAINVATWYWTSNTQISSVAIGDVNGDGKNEIVTGGSYFDGTRWIAQLCVFDGSTLGLLNVRIWYWNSNTEISSVALGNITLGPGLDIVTGGAYFDGTRWNAQLATWSGPTLALENVKTWYWTSNTVINSVAVGNITGGNALSIITGGSYNDGTRNVAQLAIWNAGTLTFNNVVNWFWTGNTEINSVAVANITGGSAQTIVTGGDYFDGVNLNAQLVEWNGSTLALQNVATWNQVSQTTINSVTVGNFTLGTSLDIVTGGSFNDGVRSNAQVISWNGASLTLTSAANWFTASNTAANSVAIGNTGFGNRIVSGGAYFDTSRSVAQIVTWG